MPAGTAPHMEEASSGAGRSSRLHQFPAVAGGKHRERENVLHLTSRVKFPKNLRLPWHTLSDFPPVSESRDFGWWPRFWLIVVLNCWAIYSQAAPPTLDYLFPPGLKRGTNMVLTVGGKFDPWPVSAWTDCSGVTFKAETNSGKFDLPVAEDAPLGPHLLRIYNQDGTSAPKSFV